MKQVLFYCFTIFFSAIIFSQNKVLKPVILKSTTTSVGSNNTSILNNSYRVIQSIGQTSILGTRNLNNTTVQQGFLTSVKTFKIDNSENLDFEESFNLSLYPNPFVDFVEISFSKKTIYDVNIYIFDLNGKLLNNIVYPPSDKIRIPFNNYQIASYIIKVASGNNVITKQIIKKD